MQKSISLIRETKNESYEIFHTRITEIVEKIKSTGPFRLHYTITLEKPPKMSVIPFRKEKIAFISITGVCLLTLFRKKKSLDLDTFIDRWHNGHTPLTLKIHPIYHYNRNEVTESLGNPPVLYDGIVEEHCLTRKELMNPFKFFAKSGLAPVNMIKTYFDVKSFIDYKSIETYLVAEYQEIS